MSDIALSRRRMLASAVGAGAFFLLPELARAQKGSTGSSGLGPAEPFSFAQLRETAQSLAREEFVPMRVADGDVLDQVDYDRHNQIAFRKDRTLWNEDGASPVQFFFPGRYFREPVHVYALQDGMAREVVFSKEFFDIPGDNPANQLTRTEGFAGFRVQDRPDGDDWMAFLGASYWRTSGYSGQFGMSVRGLALDTAIAGGPEEFPRFTRFWLDQGEDGDLTAYALLESPRATGAYRIYSARGEEGVAQDVEAHVFLRADVERLGLAPLTSMYWFGKPNAHVAPDWRPEVHDSDGLEIHAANGERIWRPLNNPPRTMASEFSAPGVKGFGLMQRERAFEEYQDDGVFYEKRASVWVEPKEDWGDGAVTLIELSTDDEIHDNIVAMWTPGGQDREHSFSYRLTWFEDAPVPPNAARFIATRIGAGGIPGQPRPPGIVKIVCDFENTGFEGLDRDPSILPVVSTSRGSTGSLVAYPVVGESYWRAIFDLDFSEIPEEDDEPIDLRMYVEVEGQARTETWLMQLFPSQLRSLLDSHA
ncbi:glucan biosynthesis protein [Celeribacter indicus]|uniref:Glucan biosynthesis protein D n=1 Tax=Celeribacter indicus TaxID=1208324 RepID=A0A0B5DUP8_9RHOB|nr:glucan biosynthesis protein D [Celeribacter indicus]AJE47138.1 glucan biosynthesis protein D [Celeribacter indicus]SDW89931.1 glucans biosynthesis protein [Celeribacter indicus]